MDSLSATTITILGKYVLDAGVTLAREVGPAARETADICQSWFSCHDTP